MALFPLGILSAAGAGGAEGDYELIQTQILASATSAVSFSVSSFASTYKHLQIRAVSRCSVADTGAEVLRLRINSDTGSNYAWHRLFGDGSSVASGASTSQTSIGAGLVIRANEAANSFTGTVIDILDPYSTSKNTTTRSLTGFTSTISQIGLHSGLFNNTAAVSAVELSPSNGNFVIGSRFSLYGIKG